MIAFLRASLWCIGNAFAQASTIAAAANMKDAFSEISIALKSRSQLDLKVVYRSLWKLCYSNHEWCAIQFISCGRRTISIGAR